jgi:hypothetical protein
MIQTEQQHICDVHRILDYDCELRTCFYCSLCDAWICQQDSNRWNRRLHAALKRKLEPGYRGDPNYNTGETNVSNGITMQGTNS